MSRNERRYIVGALAFWLALFAFEVGFLVAGGKPL